MSLQHNTVTATCFECAQRFVNITVVSSIHSNNLEQYERTDHTKAELIHDLDWQIISNPQTGFVGPAAFKRI